MKTITMPKNEAALLPLSIKLGRLNTLVETSHQLEKVAHDYQNDTENASQALTLKMELDNLVFDFAKAAGAGSFIRDVGKSPLGWGVGVGVPLTLGGSHLINKFYDRGEEATSDIRNKILQTALGTAAIGGGLYGLHRLTGGGPLGGNPPETKQAALDQLPAEIIEKLATVGLIDALLDQLPKTLPADEVKLAAEIRALNRGYGITLLYEISH